MNDNADHTRGEVPRFVRLIRRGAGLTDVINAYAAYTGRNTATRMQALFEALRERTGDPSLTYADVLDRDQSIRESFLATHLPEAAHLYPQPAGADAVQAEELLPAVPNALHRPEFTTRLSHVAGFADPFGHPTCPGYSLLHAPGAAVFANPGAHMTFLPDKARFIGSLSSRRLPHRVMQSPIVAMPEPLVIVQDGQNGANFAHLLFDWLPRILLFAKHAPTIARTAKYLFHHERQPMHGLLLNLIERRLGIPAERFLFNAAPVVFAPAGGVYGIVPQRRAAHPMGHAHPGLVNLVRELLLGVKIPPGPHERIYVSRRDAKLRRLANEADLQPVLRARGFETVALAEHPLETQIALFTGASVIAGPHGMGMALLLFHPGRPVIREIFHPARGTTAYGMIAKALGFDHGFVFGDPLPGHRLDYAITPGDLAMLLDEALAAAG